MSTIDRTWRAADTTPSKVDDALREMLSEFHREDRQFAPARVLNLVCVVDAGFGGEIANRLRGVGRYHASRTIVCSVEPERETIDAVATLSAPDMADDQGLALMRETVILSCGTEHLPRLDRLVDPLIVSELPTCVWSPHGHDEGLDSLLGLADVVLYDSADEADARQALTHGLRLSREAYLVDLSWLRTTPWRERLAATFDPVPLRGQLELFSELDVRVHPESRAAALLLIGWLASRLGWRTSPLMHEGERLIGSASGHRQNVKLSVTSDPMMPVRGLSGLTLSTAAGRTMSMDRGAGGLRAHYDNGKGIQREWTILGASRGEPGILGEGLRQAMLRDRTFFGALDAATMLLPQ